MDCAFIPFLGWAFKKTYDIITFYVQRRTNILEKFKLKLENMR